MLRVAVLISGRGSNLDALLKYREQGNASYEIVVVLSDNKEAKGLEIATARGIPTLIVPRKAKQQSNLEFNQKLISALTAYKPELVVLAGFMRIVENQFISAFEHQVINIHPSLLPAFPGLDVQQKAIETGVKFSGCTVHTVIKEVDAGEIIGQAVVPVLPGETAQVLASRILKQEHRLLPIIVQAIAAKDVIINAKTGSVSIVNSTINIDENNFLSNFYS